MRSLQEILKEGKDTVDKDEKNKIEVFVDDNNLTAFPNDTMTALNKSINRLSKDLNMEWKNSIEIVDSAFEELDIPKPTANLLSRWEQYKQLISYAVKSLYDSRGL